MYVQKLYKEDKNPETWFMKTLHNVGTNPGMSFKFYKRCKASQISTVFEQISTSFSHKHIPSKLPVKINFKELRFSIMHPEKSILKNELYK